MKQLQEFFKDQRIQSILDVGCGAGDFIKVLNDTFGSETQLLGIDPGEVWLREARARFPQENMEFRCMHGEKLAFENDQFDLVSISNALHHLAQLEQTLAEMKRVVRSGGWLIVNEVIDGELTEAQQNHRMLHHFKSYVDRLHGITHRPTWTEQEIMDLAEANDLQVKYAFLHLKMKQVNHDELFLDDKYRQMESLLEELQGRPEFDEKKDQLPLFKERLKQHGFHLAPQLLLIAQA